VTGNVTGGNIGTAGRITATGNITGGNVTTGGLVTVTGNITGGNIITAGLITATGVIQSTANVIGGNITTAGRITATANVVGGNVTTAGIVSATANITGGNILTAGIVSATGNVSGGNLIVTGNIVDTGPLSIVTASNGNITLAPNGTGTVLATSGITSTAATGGIGYSTGAGLSVIQGTNRATGVLINAVCGAITLFSVAGNTTPTSFTMTNSTIAATDVVILNQKSGTNIYNLLVSNVQAGSCQITVFTTGGITSEAPVINFAVLKAVLA
jgi:hypothetical protein